MQEKERQIPDILMAYRASSWQRQSRLCQCIYCPQIRNSRQSNEGLLVCVDLIHVRGALGAYKGNLTGKRKAVKMIKKPIDMPRTPSLFC